MKKLSRFQSPVFAALTLSVILTSQVAQADIRNTRWPMNNFPMTLNTPWHPVNYKDSFDALPLSGSVENSNIPWADSFWPGNRAGAAYPWEKYSKLETNQELSESDLENKFFGRSDYPTLSQLQNMSRAELAELSPSEKFDIYTSQSDDFKLTHVYKQLGRRFGHRHIINSPADSYWGGYCYAWSAVALEQREPLPVDVPVNLGGKTVTIPFGSGDIKAMMVMNWVENAPVSVQMGGKCKKRFSFPQVVVKNGKEVFDFYSNTDGLMEKDYPAYLSKFVTDAKRLNYVMPRDDNQQQNKGLNYNDPNFVNNLVSDLKNSPECNDTDAGAFHIILANQIGLMKEGFIVDKTRDLEVWNQPVFKYNSEVVNHEDHLPPALDSTPGTASRVHVKTTIYYADDTDFGFAFWNPTLENLFTQNQSFMDEYNVYQQVMLKNGKQDKILSYPQQLIDTAHYEYYLNLDSSRNIIGGQWLTYDRPDYIWLAGKTEFQGDYAKLKDIYKPFITPASKAMRVNLNEVP